MIELVSAQNSEFNEQFIYDLYLYGKKTIKLIVALLSWYKHLLQAKYVIYKWIPLSNMVEIYEFKL